MHGMARRGVGLHMGVWQDARRNGGVAPSGHVEGSQLFVVGECVTGIGQNYIGHNYIGHNYTFQNYTGHNYIGHTVWATTIQSITT